MERSSLRLVCEQVVEWSTRVASITQVRQRIVQSAAQAIAELKRRAVGVSRDGEQVAFVITLEVTDDSLVRAFAEEANLPVLDADDSRLLKELGPAVLHLVEETKAATGIRRFLLSAKRRAETAGAVARLQQVWNWAQQVGAEARLNRLEQSSAAVGTEHLGVRQMLHSRLGVSQRLALSGEPPVLFAGDTFGGLLSDVRIVTDAVREERTYRDQAVRAGNAVRNVEVNRLLAQMPVDRLREASRDRLRTAPLLEAGIETVLAVLQQEDNLDLIPGLGETSATRLRAAAWSIAQATFEEMPVRIDVQSRRPETTELLLRLARWDAARRLGGSPAEVARVQELKPLLGRKRRPSPPFAIVVPSRAGGLALLQQSAESAQRVAARLRPAMASGSQTTADPWAEFLSRPADFFTMLAELGLTTEDEKKSEGDLPEDIIRAVRALELKTDRLVASLRGYQAFAARFALVQQKVIIGDEMGLGKTVEALAVMCHLASKGESRFLVICPAAVVTNWVREVASKSALRPHRIHGSDKATAAKAWRRNGGVGVTTYETLGWLEGVAPANQQLDCVVLDEAHMIKNPQALRSVYASRRIDASARAILLTGTPLENRVQEFTNLANYVRPDLVVDATDFAPRRFRKQIAPAYLRRNQEDVLSELPELVEVEEWLPFSDDDHAAYAEAVNEGNFMAMRQAAMRSGRRSQKVQRLIELVEEAEENDRRVIVFSYFREVLDALVGLLPGRTFGPLTGAVPANLRQTMVDDFSKAQHGAVLLSQIVAGGVGLNIQAASVVVICEPQLKPTMEAQAVARAHRMGQVQSVQVHRLLSEEGTDVRITEILAEKKRIFDDFARVSETAASTPEALDVTEQQLAQQVIAEERQRLFAAKQASVANASGQGAASSAGQGQPGTLP